MGERAEIFENNPAPRKEVESPKSIEMSVVSAYMERLSILGDAESKFITELFPIKTFKKGTILLRAGEVASESYYNLKGLVRQYYLIDGREKSTFFYTEGHNISSMTSLSQGAPSKHYLACVEDTILTVSTKENEQKLYKQFPRFEPMCRAASEEELGNYQDMLAAYITSCPEERYFNLMDTRPELLDRVPLYHLASFLGVTPESLSRIRKRVMNRTK